MLLISSPREVLLAISWYEELVGISHDVLPGVEIAILEGEAGLTQKVADRVAEWKLLRGNFPAFAKLIEIAYLNFQGPSDETNNVDLSLLDQLENQWFRDRLITRLSMAGVVSGGEGLNAGSNVLASARVYAGMTLLTIAVSLMSIPWVLRSKASATGIGAAQIRPDWNGRTAFGVILRVAALLVLLVIGMSVLTPAPFANNSFVLVGTYLLGIVVLCRLFREYLWDKSGGSFIEALGASVPSGKYRETMSWVAVLAGAGIVGDLGIIWFSDMLGVPVHWTEWFDEDLAWGNHFRLSLFFLGVVVFAPIFEELLFRGLIFRSLRLKYSFVTAAGVSAVLFSVLHGYSVAGFFALVWTGFLWAWSFEKTKTLLPAILAHALHNLLMLIGLFLFLRI
jgi:membrane protease YdiL (CAAX protease family)